MTYLIDRLQSVQLKAIIVRGLVGEFAFFSASTIAFQVSRLAVSLIVAKWVGPEQFGVWNTLNLLLLYGALVTLGVPNGINREIPVLMGQGNEAEAKRIASLGFWFVLFSSVTSGLIISILPINFAIPQEYRHSIVWMGALFLAWQIYQYLQFWLKCHIRFRMMSIQQIGFALLLPIVVLPFARAWNVPGFIIGQAVVTIGLIAFIIKTASFKVTFFWNWDDFLSLVKTGFPIMAAGLLYSLLTSVDRWVILSMLGVEALGHYTLAILCIGVLNLLPMVIAQQLYPRMAFRYGQTKNKLSLVRLIILQSLMATIVTLPILTITYIVLPWVTNRFLPAYAPGIMPARILLIGLAFIPLVGGIANFLNTVGKQMYYLMVQTGAVLVNLGLDVLFVKMGWGLTGVALGATASYVLYAMALSMVGIWVMRRS